jgi:predicted acylesterase/phospholipase RssA/CRP-like cAMP-binding protein
MDVADRPGTGQGSSSPWVDFAARVVERGEVLVREGDVEDDVYELVEGSLEVLRGPELACIDSVGPGETVGEVAALAGLPRTATVRAREPSLVRSIDRASYQRWLAEDGHRLAELTAVARSRIDRHGAIAMVTALLGVAPAVAAEVVALSEWVDLEAGAMLFAEGDHSDAGYLVVSGRLAVSRGGVHIGEVGRGEIVGEMGLIERAPRSATVVALRDTTLARFDVDAFRALTATHPTLMLQLSRTILARLGRPSAATDRARSIAVTVVAPLDARVFVTRLANELARHGTTKHVWAARIDADLGRTGLADSSSAVSAPALAEYIHRAETTHDYLLLETDRDDTAWTRRALTLADRMVVVLPASPTEEDLRLAGTVFAAVPPRSRVERWLALVERPDTARPSGTAAVADPLGIDRVVHVRLQSADDVDRLARLVSGNATGLVLGGGGARGFAHLGVWKALTELGVQVDAVGGASIGAPLGAAIALQIEPDELVRTVAELFHGLLDYTIPVVSLVKGQRITRNIARMFPDHDVRDLWLQFFCVSTNLTRSRVEVHDRGDVATAIRASVAIPGVLPPVPFGGDLLVDGGVLNNLPCDVMRAAGTVRRLIAVDLAPPVGIKTSEDFGMSVSGWSALRAQFGSDRSRYPGLVAILTAAMVAGSARDRERMIADGTVDCHLDLDLSGVQILDFERVAEVAARGYEAARPRLEAWLEEASRCGS